MRRTKQMSITLPLDMASIVESKVASGAYASDSEVISDGLRALVARDKAMERWLNETVVSTYDRIAAGEEKTLTATEVREHLRATSMAVA